MAKTKTDPTATRLENIEAAKRAREALEEVVEVETPEEIDPDNFLGSGSTLLNLMCTDNPWCCYSKGKYHFLVGDSMSGKTWISLSAFAEAALRRDFDKHRFIYDNVEDGALMDMNFYFGEGTANRIEPPRQTADKEPLYSEKVEDFYDNFDLAIKDGRPFIYILDSMDALSSDAEAEKVAEQRKARLRNKKTSGSYGDGKAKVNSSHMRTITRELSKTDSILIIINQTRDSLGFGFETKSRSGGHALRFYATLELWLSLAGQLKKRVKEKDHAIGNKTLIKAKKNRFTGKLRKCTIPIYYSYGMDDISSCIDFLMEQDHWKASAGRVHAPEFNFSGTIPKLIKQIEDQNQEDDLRELVSQVWTEIENALRLDRKRRYQ